MGLLAYDRQQRSWATDGENASRMNQEADSVKG